MLVVCARCVIMRGHIGIYITSIPSIDSAILVLRTCGSSSYETSSPSAEHKVRSSTAEFSDGPIPHQCHSDALRRNCAACIVWTYRGEEHKSCNTSA